MNGDLILPHDSYPVDGNTNKAISYETQREIFLSRRESFPMQADINMNNNLIQNIATPTSSHQVTNKGYCDYNFLNRQKGGVLMGPLSMNRNDLFEIPAPKYGNSAVNKNYVDTEITKVHQNIDLTPFLRKDGLRAMTGSLNMNGNQIIRLKEPVSSSDACTKGYTDRSTSSFIKKDGSVQMTGDLDMDNNLIQNVNNPINSDDCSKKKYVDDEIAKIRVTDTSLFVKLDGTRQMTGDLDMNTHKINDLKDPVNDTDATNKKYIDEKLLKSHLLSATVDNAFKYLSDADESSTESNIVIHGIVDFNNSPHKNKKAYDIDMVYSPGSQNYNSKLGVNLYPLDVGKYTIVMEYFYPEDRNIIIFAQASKQTTLIKKQITTSESNFKKQLVQFDFKEKANPSYYLFFTIRGSGTTSTNPEGYLVFYGVKGWDDTVLPELYDHALESGMFEYDNGNMKMYRDIDMNNHKIKNIFQSFLIFHSILFGKIKNIDNVLGHNGLFTSLNDIKIKLIPNSYIKYINIYSGNKFSGVSDSIIFISRVGSSYIHFDINFTNLQNPTIDHYISLTINRQFRGTLFGIYTNLIFNVPFELTYLPITFP